MKTFKSITDLEQLRNHPLQSTLKELIVPVIAAYTSYRPEDDGYLVLIEPADVDRALDDLDMPWRLHHPAEYAVFSAMPKNGASNSKFHEDVSTLMKDHLVIEDIIRNAIESVGPKLVSTHPDITDIGDKLSTLINRERSHLLFEEVNIYPYIARHLSSENWKTISALIPDYGDPIFGNKARKEYELIFKAL